MLPRQSTTKIIGISCSAIQKHKFYFISYLYTNLYIELQI